MRARVHLLALAFICLTGLFIFEVNEDYRRANLAAETDTRNLVKVVESRVHGDFSRALGLIEYLAGSLPAEKLLKQDSARHRPDIERQLGLLLHDFEQVTVANVFDASGELLYSSRPDTPRFHIRDRTFYPQLTGDPQARPIIPDPHLTRSTGKRSQVMVKAIRDAQGRFLGAASIVMDLEGYTSLFSGIDIGPGGVVVLRRTDNFRLVHRMPRLNEKDFDEALPPHHPIRQRIEAGEEEGSLRMVATTDDEKRFASFRKVEGFPFYVQVSFAESHYLANWRRDSLMMAGSGVLLMVMFGYGMARLLRGERSEQEALRHVAESEARYRQISESSPSGLWQTDAQGNNTYVSPRWSEIAGLTPEAAHGQGWTTALHPDDRQQVFDGWMEAARNASPYRSEFRFVRPDGRISTVLCLARPDCDAQHAVTGWTGTITDISMIKDAEARLNERTQELLRSNAELEQFSYSISHDMRQPLRMISSYLQLLEGSLAGQLDGEQREYFHFAVDGAQRLDTMLVGLLEYSRVGRKGEPPGRVDTRSLVEELISLLQPAIDEAAALITVSGDWPSLLARPDEMARLLQNLLTNAIKFRVPGRRPEIAVSSSASAGHWHICVADNGVGIASGQAGRLFQVFQRLHSREAYEGTGVGLAICRRIVEHHGGKIRVESAGEGQGCRFLVDVPTGKDTTA